MNNKNFVSLLSCKKFVPLSNRGSPHRTNYSCNINEDVYPECVFADGVSSCGDVYCRFNQNKFYYCSDRKSQTRCCPYELLVAHEYY